ncbi:SDR family oxidoreductase [Virgibacillus alimentarius]|uniref:Uncharacterized protein YbjT (DUF2867 family) n=1 Tax=Virgibacillus alimentarius TaxID=698769 RepID=A0ABS4SC01_9BACI|nr:MULTISPECIES: SDR family oxidoreductase [Virgibacillus]MBP2259030.1 uncharacterized protein YbjT (DUF2867 family) [Virgibacillus alimentarius]HLR68246.1 SDR family oxidoreductase [Virgibacillus sp.]
MKVLVVGANGQIGRHMVQRLAKDEHHQVKAMIRKQEQADFFTHLGAETVIADLETEDDIFRATEGVDTVVFTAGSGGHTGADKTILVDLEGAFKTIEAAEKHNIKRFIMVSALHSDTPKNWKEGMEPYYTVKKRADERLRNSSLYYTILRPGWLTNEKPSGKIEASLHLGKDGSISRENVADIVVQSLGMEETFKQTIELIDGDTAIQEALSTIK